MSGINSENKLSRVFQKSVGIALNRCATQLASISITAILGLMSTNLLAEVSLALSFAAVLFSIVTTIQLGVQSEFGKYYASKDYSNLMYLLVTTTVVITCFALVMTIFINLIPNFFSTAATRDLSNNAFEVLKKLSWSLPLVGALTTITYFLESTGHIKAVVRLRSQQTILQVIVVITSMMIFSFFDLNISSQLIANSYVLSDAIILIKGVSLVTKVSKNYRIRMRNSELLKTFQSDFIIKILTLGLPVMLGMMSQRYIFYLYTKLSATLGVAEATAFSIVNSYMYFFQIPIVGVSHLATILISQSANQNRSLQEGSSYSSCLKLVLIETVIIVILLNILEPLLIPLFTRDSRVINMINSMQWLLSLYFLMNVCLYFSMGTLRGYSDTLKPQIILITALIAGVVSCNLLSPIKMTLTKMLTIFSISGFIGSTFLFYRIKKFRSEETETVYCTVPSDS